MSLIRLYSWSDNSTTGRGARVMRWICSVSIAVIVLLTAVQSRAQEALLDTPASDTPESFREVGAQRRLHRAADRAEGGKEAQSQSHRSERHHGAQDREAARNAEALQGSPAE